MSTLHEMWEAQVREQWEAQQRDRVFAQGEREAKRKVLAEQLAEKFGTLGAEVLERIEQADDATLDACLKRIVRADSIAAVLSPE
jgi:hypothetical protein